MKIKLNDLLNDQIRQIKNEIEWAVKIENFARAQELLFEMIKIQNKIKQNEGCGSVTHNKNQQT